MIVFELVLFGLKKNLMFVSLGTFWYNAYWLRNKLCKWHVLILIHIYIFFCFTVFIVFCFANGYYL